MSVDNDNVMVSIICTVYNHEQFLRKCLEGFINQKTSFKYEVLINDDASTDKSAEIIREYELKYPNIIKPIYQKENQYSKGVYITNDILLPHAKGKYIAFCEGDDFWINEHKLQLQYEIMEQKEDCVMCVHNTLIHDLLGKEKDKKFNCWPNQYILKEKDVFFGWNVHTSSYFLRKEVLNITKKFKRYWFGDYVKLTMAFNCGNIIYLSDVMSQYNFNNTLGVTYNNINNGIEKLIHKEEERIVYLKEFNKFSNYKYDNVVSERISELKFDILLRRIKLSESKSDFIKYKKKIMQDVYKKEYIRNLKLKGKIAFVLKYKSYFLFKIYKKIAIKKG